MPVSIDHLVDIPLYFFNLVFIFDWSLYLFRLLHLDLYFIWSPHLNDYRKNNFTLVIYFQIRIKNNFKESLFTQTHFKNHLKNQFNYLWFCFTPLIYFVNRHLGFQLKLTSPEIFRDFQFQQIQVIQSIFMFVDSFRILILLSYLN